MTRFYGWFDDATQSAPSYDPPRNLPCLYCCEALSPDNVRTHSIMYKHGYANRSYFFRTHRTCDDAANSHGRNLDDAIFAMIEANGD